MKLSSLILVPSLLLSCALFGCTTDSLDGGSDSNKNGADETESPDGDSLTVAEQPLGGTIDELSFEPVRIEIYFHAARGKWFLSAQNYGEPCKFTSGSLEGRTGPDKLIVSLPSIEPKAGRLELRVDDMRGTSFQRGVYEQGGQEPDYSEPAEGVLVLDSWSETAGSTVTGGMHLTTDTSSVDGTFEATICEPR